ncbi:MAG: nitroreductase family deazaflavin-dependent oxidoreductase [Acidimicrobiia bacterium]
MAKRQSAVGSGVAVRYARVMDPIALSHLRSFFRQMNRGMVLLWRVGLGRMSDVWPGGFGRLLVIEHIGRRSGHPYRTPVNYTVDEGDLYCVAAFGEGTDWYRNVLAREHIAVWLPDGRWEATAEDASDDPRRLDLMRHVLIDSGFAAPLFGLHPHRISDEDLAETTSTYRLLRIRPLRKRGGSHGPGDLAWIWLAVGVAMTVIVMWQRKRPSHSDRQAWARSATDHRGRPGGDRGVRTRNNLSKHNN